MAKRKNPLDETMAQLKKIRESITIPPSTQVVTISIQQWQKFNKLLTTALEEGSKVAEGLVFAATALNNASIAIEELRAQGNAIMPVEPNGENDVNTPSTTDDDAEGIDTPTQPTTRRPRQTNPRR